MQRGYDENQIEKAAFKKTLISALLVLIAIPLVIVLGAFWGNDNYILVSLLVLAITMLPFFMVFEKRKPKAREIVLVSVMCAVTVCAHMICKVTIPLRAGTAIIIICGIALGPESGFLIGALGRFVLNFYAGHGPWSPWQMFCWGLLGFLAGIAFEYKNLDCKKTPDIPNLIKAVICILFALIVAYLSYLFFPPVNDETFLGWRIYIFGAAGLLSYVGLRRKKLIVNNISLTLFTFLTTFILYGGLMNIFNMLTFASIPGNPEVSWDTLKMYYISGIYYDFIHAIAAAIFNFIFGEKLIKIINRIKVKYGI